MMETSQLLIAFVLFVAFLLAGSNATESPVLEAPEGAPSGDLTRLKDREFQPWGVNTK